MAFFTSYFPSGDARRCTLLWVATGDGQMVVGRQAAALGMGTHLQFSITERWPLPRILQRSTYIDLQTTQPLYDAKQVVCVGNEVQHFTSRTFSSVPWLLISQMWGKDKGWVYWCNLFVISFKQIYWIVASTQSSVQLWDRQLMLSVYRSQNYVICSSLRVIIGQSAAIITQRLDEGQEGKKTSGGKWVRG